jgi:hypothetical protein
VVWFELPIEEGTTMKKKQTAARKTRHTKRKIKTPSRKTVVHVPRSVGEDVDGCDVAVTIATLDHELPAARGGVA